MAFDIRQFENLFEDKILKSGYRLFKTDSIIHESKAGEFTTFIVDREILELKKRGYKIISYNCSCQTKNYCRHLGAAMFYLQKKELNFGITEDTGQKNLIKNFKTNGRYKKNTFATGWELYQRNARLIRQYLVDYRKSLNEGVSSLSVERLNHLFSGKGSAIPYYFALSFVVEAQVFFYRHFEQNHEPLKQLYSSSIKFLETKYTKGLSETEIEGWHAATMQSLKNNKILQQEIFVFLLPRILLVLKNKSHFRGIREGLKKRHFKTGSSEDINWLTVAILQISICETLNSKVTPPGLVDKDIVHFLVAQSELHICGNKFQKALRLLDTNYNRVKINDKKFYRNYLNYLIDQSKKYDFKNLEIKYLKEKIVISPFITENDLNRFFGILPKKEEKRIIDFLVLKFSQSDMDTHLDKLAKLLIHRKQYGRLIYELSRQKPKFHITHSVAITIWPYYNQKLLELFEEHFLQTITSTNNPDIQKNLCQKATAYLLGLPKEIKTKILKKIVHHTALPQYLSKYILGLSGNSFNLPA